MGFLAFTATEWTAIGGVAVSGFAIVAGVWKAADASSRNARVDLSKTEAGMRLELREANAALVKENGLQYERMRALQLERDMMEDEARRAYDYIDEIAAAIAAHGSAPGYAALPPRPLRPVQLMLPSELPKS